MKQLLFGTLMMLSISSASAALPGDAIEGQRLHDANCMSCHNSSVYTRANRQIRSLDALKGQLQGCGHMVKKELSTTDTQNILKYLNEGFYHFQ